MNDARKLANIRSLADTWFQHYDDHYLSHPTTVDLAYDDAAIQLLNILDAP